MWDLAKMLGFTYSRDEQVVIHNIQRMENRYLECIQNKGEGSEKFL